MTRTTDTWTRLTDDARCAQLAPESDLAKLDRRFASIKAKAAANATAMRGLTGRLAYA
jgi:hypothetical protein